jgi:hypothetical protein
MKSYRELPTGYRQILDIDLQKNKKLALLVNGLALLIGVVMIAAALPLVPVWSIFENDDLLGIVVKLAVMYGGMIVYIILHEAVHGIAMRRFSDAKVRFGFTGLYAYAGSDAYYCRKHYIIIALAPIVVWGVVLAILNVLVPEDWFYVVYMIQMANISGAAGDLYVSWKMNRLPADILVHDIGVAMTVYSAEI